MCTRAFSGALPLPFCGRLGAHLKKGLKQLEVSLCLAYIRYESTWDNCGALLELSYFRHQLLLLCLLPQLLLTLPVCLLSPGLVIKYMPGLCGRGSALKAAFFFMAP